MKVATMTTEQCEAELGPRGSFYVTKANRWTIRKWLTAQGLKSEFVNHLTYVDLAAAYNDISGQMLETLRRTAAAKAANGHSLPQAIAGTPTPADIFDGANDAAETIAPPVKGANVVGNADPQDAVAAAVKTLMELFNQQQKQQPLDIDAVRQIVRDEVKGLKPRPVEVKIGDRPAVLIEERVNPVFDRVLKHVTNGANVLLVGPAGCGKSHLCEQIARALKADFGAIHGTAGASESALTGWLLPSDGGKFEYVPSRFVELYEGGNSLFCFDEMDAFDPNMLMVVNGATSNGHIHIAHRRHMPRTKRGDNVYLMATANTYGTGANPVYTARAALDGATNDRWLIVTVDYDKALETDIGTASGLTAAEMAAIWNLRDKVREAGLRRIVSTRAFQKAGIMKASGDAWSTIMATLVEGWTRDEKAKVGV